MKSISVKKIILSTAVLLGIFLMTWNVCLWASDEAAPQNHSFQYESAKDAYYKHEYAKAEDIFFNLSRELGDKNGYLFYNLGNTYFNMGKMGRAIQYYEKAALFIPRYPELKQNLVLARAKLADTIDESFGDYLLRTFYFWAAWVSFYEFQFVLVVVTFLFWGALTWRRLYCKTLMSHTVLVLLLCYGYFTLGCWLKSEHSRPGEFGIILLPEVEAKASYLEREKSLFVLHEGTRVRLIDEQDLGPKNRWIRVALPAGQKAWVKSNTIGRI